MGALNWIEKAKISIKGSIDLRKADHAWEEENRNDYLLMKNLNRELRKFHVRLRMERYEDSPFSENDTAVIPIILKYVGLCEKKHNKAHLLTTLRSPRFYEVVPHLIDFYKKILADYHLPEDEMVLLSVCETIEKIGSDRYIDQYIDLLHATITPSAECLIRLLCKMPRSPQIDACIFSLVEKENKIPEAWVGRPNETDKYWCSQVALSCIVETKTSSTAYLEQFLTPQKLPWIHFTESKYCKYNYLECYKSYIKIASEYMDK